MSNYQEWAIKNSREDTPLLRLFFSNENILYLQNETKKKIKEIVGVDIAQQDIQYLIGLMMGMYESSKILSSEGLENDLIKLNQKLVEKSIKNIISGLKAYKEYHYHASHLPVPLAHARNVNNKGLNILEEKGYVI